MVDEYWLQEMEQDLNRGLEIDEEDHLCCPAYPNCDLYPLGCHYTSGEDVEWYGHKD